MVQNIIVPISVSSLKALHLSEFTCITSNPDGFMSVSSGFKRYRTFYELFVGSVAIPTTPMQVQSLGNNIGKGTHTEVMAKMLRAWHIWLNNQEIGTLLQP